MSIEQILTQSKGSFFFLSLSCFIKHTLPDISSGFWKELWLEQHFPIALVSAASNFKMFILHICLYSMYKFKLTCAFHMNIGWSVCKHIQRNFTWYQIISGTIINRTNHDWKFIINIFSYVLYLKLSKNFQWIIIW